MAKPILLPKQGNTVESCIILKWYKSIGDEISVGDLLCEVETDKATFEIESPESGLLIGRFFDEGDLVPVMTTIAAVGEAGEDASDLSPSSQSKKAPESQSSAVSQPSVTSDLPKETSETALLISPRAKRLANQKKIDWSTLDGSGPNGRIIERDVSAAVANAPKLTPVARRMLESGNFRSPPDVDSGRPIRSADLIPSNKDLPEPALPRPRSVPAPIDTPERLASVPRPDSSSYLPTVTLRSSADATPLLTFAQRLKSSDPALGLSQIESNDLIYLAIVKTLLNFSALNARLDSNGLQRFSAVHLGFALYHEVETVIPVLHNGQSLSLKSISSAVQSLTVAAQVGILNPNQLQGGTFTVFSAGSLGVEQVTPALVLPQVASLGVGEIELKPTAILESNEITYAKRLPLTLTINQQAVNERLAARFLQSLASNIEMIDLIAVT